MIDFMVIIQILMFYNAILFPHQFPDDLTVMGFVMSGVSLKILRQIWLWPAVELHLKMSDMILGDRKR